MVHLWFEDNETQSGIPPCVFIWMTCSTRQKRFPCHSLVHRSISLSDSQKSFTQKNHCPKLTFESNCSPETNLKAATISMRIVFCSSVTLASSELSYLCWTLHPFSLVTIKRARTPLSSSFPVRSTRDNLPERTTRFCTLHTHTHTHAHTHTHTHTAEVHHLWGHKCQKYSLDNLSFLQNSLKSLKRQDPKWKSRQEPPTSQMFFQVQRPNQQVQSRFPHTIQNEQNSSMFSRHS